MRRSIISKRGWVDFRVMPPNQATKLDTTNARSRPLDAARSRLLWLADFVRSPYVTFPTIAAVFAVGMVLTTFGLGRSLWLDEAWEANAIIAPSLRIMLYHSTWLPTCPPPFPILVKMAVEVFGFSNTSFRLVPSLMGIISAASMFALSWRVFSRRYAVLSSALFILSPISSEYSRTLKQYTLELAVSTIVVLLAVMYLQRPTRRRFFTLTAAVVVGLFFSYPVAFLLPGLVLVVLFSDSSADVSPRSPNPTRMQSVWRAFILATSSAVMLVAEGLLFILPNAADSSAFRAFWSAHNGTDSFARVAASRGYRLLKYLPISERLFQRKALVCSAAIFLLLVGFVLAYVKFRVGKRIWLELQLICLMPCVLLILADWFNLYPMVERTGLFLLPLVVILVVSSLQLIAEFVADRVRRQWLVAAVDVSMLCVTLLVLWIAIATNPISRSKTPEEEVAGAVSYLHDHATPSDIVWVHASVAEGFKLYSRMTDWNDAPAKFGNTGWPCCSRAALNMAGASTQSSVRSDLDTGVPPGFSGTVWLLYTTRPRHWQLVGIDESLTMRDDLIQRGCSQTATPLFTNIGVDSFNCKNVSSEH